MSDARGFFPLGSSNIHSSSGCARDNICIDTMRILDSCRDKDCFEDVQVLISDFGQEIIEKTGSIRVKSTKIVCSNIMIDPIQFNRGFYQVTVRFYTKICFEACLCLGKTQEFEGIAITEKKVVLYGNESNVRTFKSSPTTEFCAPCIEPEEGSNEPTVVVEAVDPIALSVKTKEKQECCHCCCCADDLPERVCACLNNALSDYRDNGKRLYVSLGFFSVVRIERPAQLVVSATEYCIPDKECVMADDDDPCKIFEKMAFPISEFCPGSSNNQRTMNNYPSGCSNGYKK